MKNWEEIVKKIEDYMNDNPSEFEQIAEELDQIDGFLGDDRYYSMDELDEFYSGKEPSEVLRRAFYGYDDDTYDAESDEHGEFCPNREYFYFNGYGNLVSSDYKDYSSHLDEYFVSEMIANRPELTIDPELAELLDEAEAIDNE